MTEAQTAPQALVCTIPETAEQLRISRSQVYNLIRSGALACVRYPTKDGDEDGAIRIEQAEIRAFIERNRVNGTAPAAP
jgi:predicted DNA-binding transcriptional regulator AlpA